LKQREISGFRQSEDDVFALQGCYRSVCQWSFTDVTG